MISFDQLVDTVAVRASEVNLRAYKTADGSEILGSVSVNGCTPAIVPGRPGEAVSAVLVRALSELLARSPDSPDSISGREAQRSLMVRELELVEQVEELEVAVEDALDALRIARPEEILPLAQRLSVARDQLQVAQAELDAHRESTGRALGVTVSVEDSWQ